MDKKEIMNNKKFIHICNKLGIDGKDFEIYNNGIVLNTKLEDIKVFLDIDYNIMKIHKILPKYMDVPLEEEVYFCSNWFNNKCLNINIPGNISNISYKQMVDIYNLVCNNKELYTLFDNNYIRKYEHKDNIRTIIFICILGNEIKKYFYNAYEFAMMNLQFMTLDDYIKEFIKNICDYIESYLNNEIMIFPSEVLKILEENNNDEIKELFGVISSILEGEAYKIKEEYEADDYEIYQRLLEKYPEFINER